MSKRARMPRCGMQGTCGAMPFNTHPAGSALPCLIRLLCAEWTCDAPLGTDDAKGATMIGARHGHKEAMQESNNKSSKLQEAKRVSKRWLFNALVTLASMSHQSQPTLYKGLQPSISRPPRRMPRWLLRPRERMPRCGMGCLFDPRPVSPLPPCLGALLWGCLFNPRPVSPLPPCLGALLCVDMKIRVCNNNNHC